MKPSNSDYNEDNIDALEPPQKRYIIISAFNFLIIRQTFE
jgi:hypothetical protein